MIRVPPRRLLASPMVETVTSIRLPARANAGNVDDDPGDVLGLKLFALHVDAESLQQIDQRFLGIGRIAQTVAGTVQTDDQAVAHQIVAAYALDLDQVLDAHGGRRRGGIDKGQAQGKEIRMLAISRNW
jgi:hypothetical protein